MDLAIAAQALVQRAQEFDHADVDRRHLSRIVAAQHVIDPIERLAVIEAATRLIREDLSQPELSEKSEDEELALAAAALLADYQSDQDLTAFTSLDSEDFRHA